jgi:hypothetical protein
MPVTDYNVWILDGRPGTRQGLTKAVQLSAGVSAHF